MEHPDISPSSINLNEFYKEHHHNGSIPHHSNDHDPEKGVLGRRDHPGWLHHFQSRALQFADVHERTIKRAAAAVFAVLYLGYFVTAVVLDFHRALALVVITAFVFCLLTYNLIKTYFGVTIEEKFLKPLGESSVVNLTLRWIAVPGLIVAYISYLSFSVIKSSSQVRPIVLLFLLLGVPLLTCKHPRHIRWRPLLWGLGLQFVLGVAVLRWKPGYSAIKFVAQELNKFLEYSFAGAGLVFGDPFFFLHPFAMMVIPMVIYIGSAMAICTHFGLTQTLMAKFGWLMSVTFGTTGVESASLIANIFLSVLDIAVLLEPFTPHMTKSEFHTMVVGCHASIAGFAYAIFVWFGNSPQHLITAALMSAPAAVAIAKLNYPETEATKFRTEEDFWIKTKKERNVVEAAIKGAFQAAKASTALMVEILACYSLYVFANVTVGWFMSRVSISGDLETIFGYTFMPLMYMIGVDWSEAFTVGRVMGLKLIPNEMLAYLELGTLRTDDKISEKATALTTYAICGFSSLGTFIIFVGIWAVLSKGKASNLSTMLLRSYMNTNVACFITACVAGMLYDEGVLRSLDDTPKPSFSIISLLSIIPGYETILNFLPGW